MGSTMQHDERGCSADAAMAVTGSWEATQMQRELSYICSSGSGRAMGSSLESNSAVDARQQAKHQHKYQCGRISVMFSGGTLLEHIPR